MKQLMLATVAIGALAWGSAEAVPFNGAYSVTVYRTANGGGQITSDRVQASPNNPIFTDQGAQIASFQYSGPLNFVNNAISLMPTNVRSDAYTLPDSGSTFRLLYIAANATPSVLTLMS